MLVRPIRQTGSLTLPTRPCLQGVPFRSRLCHELFAVSALFPPCLFINLDGELLACAYGPKTTGMKEKKGEDV